MERNHRAGEAAPSPGAARGGDRLSLFQGGGLVIRVFEIEAGPIYLSWEGRGNERDPSATLGTFLQAVVAYASERGASLELRCERLAFINSGTVGCLVARIRRCADANVALRLCYDATKTWQRLSFQAMEAVARDGHLVLASV